MVAPFGCCTGKATTKIWRKTPGRIPNLVPRFLGVHEVQLNVGFVDSTASESLELDYPRLAIPVAFEDTAGSLRDVWVVHAHRNRQKERYPPNRQNQ